MQTVSTHMHTRTGTDVLHVSSAHEWHRLDNIVYAKIEHMTDKFSDRKTETKGLASGCFSVLTSAWCLMTKRWWITTRGEAEEASDATWCFCDVRYLTVMTEMQSSFLPTGRIWIMAIRNSGKREQMKRSVCMNRRTSRLGLAKFWYRKCYHLTYDDQRHGRDAMGHRPDDGGTEFMMRVVLDDCRCSKPCWNGQIADDKKESWACRGRRLMHTVRERRGHACQRKVRNLSGVWTPFIAGRREWRNWSRRY